MRAEFITDGTLLSDVRANGGPTQAVIDRMPLRAKAAEISGADLISNSCSTVGEVADIYAKEVSVPVMKINPPMAREAVSLGTKIALIATLRSTTASSWRASGSWTRWATTPSSWLRCPCVPCCPTWRM